MTLLGSTILGEDVNAKVPAFEVASATGIDGNTTDVDEEQLSEFMVAKARQQIWTNRKSRVSLSPLPYLEVCIVC
jgi:hypothetical protein